MTAVARLTIDNHPLLVGDLLTSGIPLPRTKLVLPTADDLSVAFPDGSPRVPRSLAQKISILGDNLVTGWSGSRQIACDVLSRLAQMSATQPFTLESLQRHLDSLDSSIWSKFGLVGFIRDGKTTTQFGMGKGYHRFSANLFGEVGLLGSGSASMERFLGAIKQLPQSNDRKVNPLERSVWFGQFLSGVFLRTEMDSLESLKNFYGGGYEIASSVAGKFRKIDDICYLFWNAEAQVSRIKVTRIPIRAFRYAYQGDVLIIRAASINDSDFRDDVFVVPPLYSDLYPQDLRALPKPSFNSRWLCNYVLVQLPNGATSLLTMVLSKGEKMDRWVKFTEIPGGLDVAVQGEFLLRVQKNIAEELNVTS